MRTISGAVLAGGKSSRMKTNKVWLTCGDESFITHGIRVVSCFDDVLVSVDDKGKFGDLSCKMVEDTRQGFGPLEGIRQVLEAAAHEYVVCVAVDMPFLESELLQALADRITGEEDAVVLLNHGKPQPMCSIYKKTVIPVIQEMMDTDTHKIRLLFDRIQCTYVEISDLGFDEQVIMNVNTPEEYELMLNARK